MNKNILNTGVQNFITNNWSTDIVSVLLKKPIFEGVTQKEVAEQLEAKKKCRNKLPTWFTTPKIYYPNKLNIEQSSSEETALYKANLVSGKTLLDTTGGFGVDSYFFSKKVGGIFHCELNPQLSAISAHNFKSLGVENVSCISSDGLEFMRQSKYQFDWIYIDPSRRHDAKGKVFQLEDCLPNVPSHLNQIFEKTNQVLLKTSPLLDISKGLSELRFVKEIHVVAVKNEVKELLWVLDKTCTGEIQLKTVNLRDNEATSFDFYIEEETQSKSEFGPVEDYLFEPNAAILKAGGFKVLGNRLGLRKLHFHSHLYTSAVNINFPGRVFLVKKVVPYSKKEMKRVGLTKANITTRNFPDSVDSLRKKHKIKEGGEDYLFFTTDLNNTKIGIHCIKAD